MSADSPVAVIFDQNGNAIESVASGSDHYLGVAGIQDVHVSAGNTSSDNILAGESFTGTSDTTFGVVGIQVMIKSDQILSVTVQQSNDETNWDVEDQWLTYPDIGSGRTVQAVGGYFRVVVVNLSPNNTTYMRLTSVLCPQVEAVPRSLTSYGNLKMAQGMVSAYPDEWNFTDVNTQASLRVDWKGSLMARAAVLTDEISFRDDFADGGIDTALTGVLTFIDDVYVVGNSTSFTEEVTIGAYIKLDADASTTFTQVKDVVSDTLLILEENYQGTPDTGAASLAHWMYNSGTGGSIDDAATAVEITTGASAGGHAEIYKNGDYPPFSLMFVASMDQRVENQHAYMGMMDERIMSAEKVAVIAFDGEDDTKVKLLTSHDSADPEETEITLPNGATSDELLVYKLEVHPTKVSLWISDIRVAEHYRHIPGPYDEMFVSCGAYNSGAVSGAGTLTVDVVYFENFNIVDTALSSSGDPLPVVPYKSPTATVSSVEAAVADTALLAANPLRGGATVFNDSTSVLYLKLGTGASNTDFTVRMGARAYYEIPYGYTGAVHGYWASAAGDARITEVQ